MNVISKAGPYYDFKEVDILDMNSIFDYKDDVLRECEKDSSKLDPKILGEFKEIWQMVPPDERIFDIYEEVKKQIENLEKKIIYLLLFLTEMQILKLIIIQEP